MTLKARVARLEAIQAPTSPFVMVIVEADQTEEEAVAARFGDNGRP